MTASIEPRVLKAFRVPEHASGEEAAAAIANAINRPCPERPESVRCILAVARAAGHVLELEEESGHTFSSSEAAMKIEFDASEELRPGDAEIAGQELNVRDFDLLWVLGEETWGALTDTQP